MAGFRTFATGEVLTAANVNNFLMKQSVMVFADATARTAALGTDVVEGMVTYNKADEELQVFDGAAFVSAAGGLVAVKSAILNTAFSAALADGVNAPITGLSITHTVADADNRVILSVSIGKFGTTSGFGLVGFAVAVDGTPINVGAAVGSRTRVTAGGRLTANNNTSLGHSTAFTTVHTPGAGEKVYTVNHYNIGGGTRTNFINRSVDDTDAAGETRTVSTITLMEVKV